jgi:hypothetical protein
MICSSLLRRGVLCWFWIAGQARFSGSLPSTVRAAAAADLASLLAWNTAGRTGMAKLPTSWTTSPPNPFLNS